MPHDSEDEEFGLRFEKRQLEVAALKRESDFYSRCSPLCSVQIGACTSLAPDLEQRVDYSMTLSTKDRSGSPVDQPN